MALDINTIKQASPKANQVATEQYVDTSIASIPSADVTDYDGIAHNLGYSSYAAMTSAAVGGHTVINGGYINTSLIQADSVFANNIMSKDITFSGRITGGSGGLGGIIQSYNGNMVIDLVNGSIYIA